MVQIDMNLCLKQFCRLGPKDVMDYSFLCKAFGILSSETLQAINVVLATYASKKAKIAKRKIRKNFRKLIAGVQRLVDIAEPFAAFAIEALGIELKAIGHTLQALVPDVKKIISQAPMTATWQLKLSSATKTFMTILPRC